MRETLTLIGCFIAISLSATIRITGVQAATASGCNGKIYITATGSAGPFDLLIHNRDGAGNDELIRNQQGNITLTNLCARNYQVTVFPSRFKDCRTLLRADVENGNILINNFPPPTKSATSSTSVVASVDVYPNPTTTGWATLTWNPGEPLTTPLTGGDFLIHDKSGRLLLSGQTYLSVDETGKLSARVNLANLPPALYLVTVAYNTYTVTTKVVVQY